MSPPVRLTYCVADVWQGIEPLFLLLRLTLLFVSSARSSYRHSDLQLIQPHPLVRSYQSSIKTLIPNCSSQATSLIKSTHSTHLVATGVPFGYYLVTIWLKLGCPILVYISEHQMTGCSLSNAQCSAYLCGQPCGQHMANIKKGTGRCPTVDLVTEHLA